jgi:hypothetical protein
MESGLLNRMKHANDPEVFTAGIRHAVQYACSAGHMQHQIPPLPSACIPPSPESRSAAQRHQRAAHLRALPAARREAWGLTVIFMEPPANRRGSRNSRWRRCYTPALPGKT